MGNVTAIIVVCSICGFLILMLILFYKKLSNKSTKSKLEEEIKRYKNLNNGDAVDYNYQNMNKTKKDLKKEKKVQNQTTKIENRTLKLQNKINSKISMDSLEETNHVDESNIEEAVLTSEEKDLLNSESFKKNSDLERLKKQNEKFEKDLEREKEFDKFMDEFSYSRLPNNKNIMKQIEELPPKIKAIVLGNIFNKFDD